ncbi:hypothetical protein D9757_006914 [Collybiopsis confluens]|uniref:Uncharacterized protein n=1 Tax=Collybiopsis confluens TaxID=2823264 RepID=A0A8H5HIK6_9AGAR|nr:hypothetical protein D9757_006914 [Collybiopsis confluens]
MAAAQTSVDALLGNDPLTSSFGAETSFSSNEPFSEQAEVDPSAVSDSATGQKKKKKKKPKKSAAAKAKEAAARKSTEAEEAQGRPSPLCISRNKHWRYISSYHGPWLQLPVELLDSLLVLNQDPATLFVPESVPQSFSNPRISGIPTPKLRDRGFNNLRDPDSPGPRFSGHEHSLLTATTAAQLSPVPPWPLPKPGKAPPPPIDPGVFRNVTLIRRLIDEAAELSVRASSGLSASEMASPGMMGGLGGYALNGSTWAAAQTLGINPLGGNSGRNVAMSAMRIHRLRALAVQKLAQAYKADEIASSVMVMQGGSVFDDVAERVLKVDPNDPDAKYVHFFHEKIPSRQLAESTTTQTLDELIAAHPYRLEFYRTRGVVHCFREEYPLAIKDFTHALKEARAARKAKTMSHDHNDHNGGGKSGMRRDKGGKGVGGNGKKKKGKGSGAGGARTNGRAPPSGTSSIFEELDDGVDGGGDNSPGNINDFPTPLHPSALPDAPEPIEPQLLFLRGSAYLQQAARLIELAVLDVEGLDEHAKPREDTPKRKSNMPREASLSATYDPSEIRLCYLPDSVYGGVEINNPAGPLGGVDGAKLKAYRKVLSADKFRDQIASLVKKSIRDQERFVGHFDTLEAELNLPKGDSSAEREDLKDQTEYAFLLSESTRPGNYSPSNSGASSPYADTSFTPSSAIFTTYHPLLVESHYMILLCLLILGDFSRILPTFIRTAHLVDGLEGYPVFLPPRSMAQAEFVEVLERLASGWKKGAFEDEFALVTVGERNNGTATPPASSSSRTASTATSAYSGAGSSSSGSSSPTTTTTELYEDLSSSVQFDASLATEGQSSSTSTLGPRAAGSSNLAAGNSSTTQSSSPNPSALRRPDAVVALDSLRILLAPVITRQNARAADKESEKEGKREKSAGGSAHGQSQSQSQSKALVSTKGKGKASTVGAVAPSLVSKKSAPINIPLHGPRVEVLLAWLGAVHLPELDV